MTKHKQSPDELEAHLAEQLGLLLRAANAFDLGYDAEAKRLAVGLRVLLHTSRHPSLLKQLGKDDISFLDTAVPPVPGNLLATHSLVGLEFSHGTVRYCAHLDGPGELRMTPFQEWWTATIFVDSDRRSFTRADVVLGVANQDGGAHVDSALRADYAALTRLNSLGWTTGSDDMPRQPLMGAERAAVRQIVHEVLRTLIPGYGKTRNEVLAARRQPEVGGGKMRFYPWGEFFMKSDQTGPTEGGTEYLFELDIDSISCGSVYGVVGEHTTRPITSPGKHQCVVRAGPTQAMGVFGSFTDAVLAWVSAREIIVPRK